MTVAAHITCLSALLGILHEPFGYWSTHFIIWINHITLVCVCVWCSVFTMHVVCVVFVACVQSSCSVPHLTAVRFVLFKVDHEDGIKLLLNTNHSCEAGTISFNEKNETRLKNLKVLPFSGFRDAHTVIQLLYTSDLHEKPRRLKQQRQPGAQSWPSSCLVNFAGA